jgi:IclR family KDG regulon transcriptional repressor
MSVMPASSLMPVTVNRPADKPENRPKTRLSSVANAIRVVKVLLDDQYEIGISDLSKRLRLPKSTVHRLASTLVESGMLEQNSDNGKYRLGLIAFELGSLVKSRETVSSMS